jgi:hypothetical protein
MLTLANAAARGGKRARRRHTFFEGHMLASSSPASPMHSSDVSGGCGGIGEGPALLAAAAPLEAVAEEETETSVTACDGDAADLTRVSKKPRQTRAGPVTHAWHACVRARQA